MITKNLYRFQDSSHKSIHFIIDDQDPEVTYLCNVQKQNVTHSFFRNTWTSIDSPDCGGAWFQLKFNGTRAYISSRFHSNESDYGFPYAIQIDGSPLLPQSNSNPYTSPVLSPSEHTLVYASGNASLFPAFDYAVITAGPSTPVRGKNIIVDDTDNTGVLQYTGNWGVLSPETFASDSDDSSSGSYRNTTHWAWGIGDSVKISFVGTAISLYRTIPRSTLYSATTPDVTGMPSLHDGNITLSYTLDSNSPINFTLPLTSGSTQVIPFSKFLDLGFNPLYSADSSASAGNHTLWLKVTEISFPASSSEVGGGTHVLSPGFGFDFLTYKAAFDDLNSMPSLSGGANTNGNSNGNNNIHNDGGLSVFPQFHVSTTQTVCAVLGGIALVVLFVSGLVCCHRRRNRVARASKNETQSELELEKPGSGSGSGSLAGRSRMNKLGLSLSCKGSEGRGRGRGCGRGQTQLDQDEEDPDKQENPLDVSSKLGYGHELGMQGDPNAGANPLPAPTVTRTRSRTPDTEFETDSVTTVCGDDVADIEKVGSGVAI